jgi:predicted site-specific integrase-resolvase
LIYTHQLSNIVSYLTDYPALRYTVAMKLSAYAKHQGISYQTAWRMWRRGELPAHQLPSFCARFSGRRRASRKKIQLLAALEGN